MRILIAEDDVDSRLMLQKNLEGAGHAVEVAVNGEDALARARKSPPELIISDILMPVLDGYKFCYEVKNDKTLNHIPFVFYTATYVDQEDERLAIGLGASRYILKPVAPEEFLRMIDEVVREAQAQTLAVPEEVQEAPFNLFRLYDASVSRKLHEKVRELELYRLIFDNTTEAVAIANRAGFVMRQNPAQHRLLGYTEEELQGKSPTVYLEEKTGAVIRGRLALNAIAEGEGWAFCKGGKRIAVEYSVFPIRDERNEISAQVWMLRDISERKSLTAQLLQAQKMEAIGKLAGGVAHDFNNLLTVILGYVGIALYKLQPTEPLAHDLKQVESAAKKATNLVRQLLLFGRKNSQIFAPIDLGKTIAELLKMLHRVIGEDIMLVLDFADDCWEIKADPGNIEQVVMNFAVNARDAMPDGGVLSFKTANVVIDEQYCSSNPEARLGRFVCFSVSDTGMGVSAAVLPHIFEPFFTTKEVGKGTGLGLSVVYGIVQSHKGWIEVDSPPGQGMTFRLYFPVVSAAIREEAGGTIPESVMFSGQGEKILVVEDDEMIRELELKSLAKNGYAVIGAASAEEGLVYFAEQEDAFALVLSDVVLPGLNGIAFVEELRKKRPDLCVLLCSGYASQEKYGTLIKEGGYSFMEKPFTVSQLLAEVQAALGKS